MIRLLIEISIIDFDHWKQYRDATDIW
jgi:hypothetical protein